MNGIVCINKPKGISSFGVVQKIRNITGIKKVGHSGTLDPGASGLLVIGVGDATKILRYIQDQNKEYYGVVKLGQETDTCDSEGNVIKKSDVPFISLDSIISVVQNFTGDILQSPPDYCAKKINGKRAYHYACKGIKISLDKIRVTVYNLYIKNYDEFNNEFDFSVNCSKGTYVRSLARDIGLLIGCGAYLKKLERVKIGNYQLKHALNLDDITKEKIAFNLIPIKDALYNLYKFDVDYKSAEMLRSGRSIRLQTDYSGTKEEKVLVVYQKKALCIGETARSGNTCIINPKKVFNNGNN